MRAALTVARELLRCRMMESGRDTLLERVAELLDAAASGAPPFCYRLPPQATAGPRGEPHHVCAPSATPGGFVNISTTGGVGGSNSPMPPSTSTSASVASHGPSEMPRYHPQDAMLGRATWSVGHYGEVFEVTAPEAYVPHMMDQGYVPEDGIGSFVGEDWGEGALGAEAFQ